MMDDLALLRECMDFAWDDPLRIQALPILLDGLAGSTAANDTRLWRTRLRRVSSAVAPKGAR